MVDKKETKIPVKKDTPKPKTETKEQAFKRLAKVRMEKVLKSIRILGNCSNRVNYSYSKEQINKMRETLYNSLDNMFSKFTESKEEQETFEF